MLWVAGISGTVGMATVSPAIFKHVGQEILVLLSVFFVFSI
jgi:hypothetical protein